MEYTYFGNFGMRRFPSLASFVTIDIINHLRFFGTLLLRGG